MSGFTEQKMKDKLNSITLSIIAVKNYSFFFQLQNCAANI